MNQLDDSAGHKSLSVETGAIGNSAGKPKKPRRSFDVVRRLEALHVDPLEEVVALAQNTALPKVARLKEFLRYHPLNT